MSEPSTAVERRHATSVTEAARAGFSEEQMAVIRDTVAPEATKAEFELLLEVAARYELNPLVGELYLAKMPGKDGQRGRMALIVGKNGMLRVAGRQEGYRGVRADVVHANDDFRVEHGADGPTVRHSYDLSDKGGEKGRRGEILGAWAIVYRDGREEVFFYAPLADYLNDKNRSWQKYPSAMIRKVAVANALREQFSLSGLYDEAEMSQVVEALGVTEVDEGVDYGDDPELAERLRLAIERAAQIDPREYRPAKIAGMVRGANDAEREALVADIERFIAEHEAEAPAEPEPVDAEVVPDSETEPEQPDETAPQDAPASASEAAEAVDGAPQPPAEHEAEAPAAEPEPVDAEVVPDEPEPEQPDETAPQDAPASASEAAESVDDAPQPPAESEAQTAAENGQQTIHGASEADALRARLAELDARLENADGDEMEALLEEANEVQSRLDELGQEAQ